MRGVLGVAGGADVCVPPYPSLHEVVDSLPCPLFHVVGDIHGDGGQGCEDDTCVVDLFFVVQTNTPVSRF